MYFCDLLLSMLQNNLLERLQIEIQIITDDPVCKIEALISGIEF